MSANELDDPRFAELDALVRQLGETAQRLTELVMQSVQLIQDLQDRVDRLDQQR